MRQDGVRNRVIDPFAIFPFRFNVGPRGNNTDRATAACGCS
jgi:hypothetical protein